MEVGWRQHDELLTALNNREQGRSVTPLLIDTLG